MRVFSDPSAFAKRYLEEVGSEEIDRLLPRASVLAVSVILVPEVVSALNRKRREKTISIEMYRTAKTQLLEDVREAIELKITPTIIERSADLLENNTLHGMDALHVASALDWETELFATSDKRQLEAARNAGLHAEYIGDW